DDATCQFGQAEEQIGRALHYAERGGAEADRAEIQREDRGDHLVPDVGEEGGEHDPDDGPRDPRCGHAGGILTLRPTSSPRGKSGLYRGTRKMIGRVDLNPAGSTLR